MEGMIPCPRCNGTGHIPIDNGGATPWRAQHCPDCGGTGWIPADGAEEEAPTE